MSSFVFHLFVLLASNFIFPKNLQAAFWCEVTHYSNFYELLFRSLEQHCFKNFYPEISAVLKKQVAQKATIAHRSPMCQGQMWSFQQSRQIT